MRWLNNLFKRQLPAEVKPADPQSPAVPENPQQPEESLDDYALRHSQAEAKDASLAPAQAVPAQPPAMQAPVRAKEPDKAGETVSRRARRAAESLMENEALTENLDDTAAGALLKWGSELSKTVAQSTADLDDEQAEEAMSERMRATRQLLRSVNKWIAGQAQMASEEKSALLARINEQMALIYGAEFSPPDAAQLEAFMQAPAQEAADPAQIVARLRDLYQPPPGSI